LIVGGALWSFDPEVKIIFMDRLVDSKAEKTMVIITAGSYSEPTVKAIFTAV
jgi:hypothetical protein